MYCLPVVRRACLCQCDHIIDSPRKKGNMTLSLNWHQSYSAMQQWPKAFASLFIKIQSFECPRKPYATDSRCSGQLAQHPKDEVGWGGEGGQVNIWHGQVLRIKGLIILWKLRNPQRVWDLYMERCTMITNRSESTNKIKILSLSWRCSSSK